MTETAQDSAAGTTPPVDRLTLAEAENVAKSVDIPDQFVSLPLYQMMMQNPRFAKSVADMMMSTLDDTLIDKRITELVLLRIGWIMPCAPMWAGHWNYAQDNLGFDSSVLLAARDWQAHTELPGDARAALAMADDLVTNGTVSPQTWASVAAAFPSAPERMQLLAATSLYRMVSGLLNALQVPFEAGPLWPPDGVAPAPGTEC